MGSRIFPTNQECMAMIDDCIPHIFCYHLHQYDVRVGSAWARDDLSCSTEKHGPAWETRLDAQLDIPKHNSLTYLHLYRVI